jgi:hypothetical protein
MKAVPYTLFHLLILPSLDCKSLMKRLWESHPVLRDGRMSNVPLFFSATW